jgi:hypothetical protein
VYCIVKQQQQQHSDSCHRYALAAATPQQSAGLDEVCVIGHGRSRSASEAAATLSGTTEPYDSALAHWGVPKQLCVVRAGALFPA